MAGQPVSVRLPVAPGGSARDSAMPALHDADVEVVAAAAVQHGADRAKLAAALSAGLAAGSLATADLVALAAWRAGALALRDDALRRLPTLDAEGAAAVLGFAAHDVADFAAKQVADRWFVPGAGSPQLVGEVGGFEGFGGAWTSRPDGAVPLAEDGAFALREGERWWRLDADAWCARLVPLESAPPESEAITGVVHVDGTALAQAEWSAGLTVTLGLGLGTYVAQVWVARA